MTAEAKRIEALREHIAVMGQILHNNVVAQQAAWLEWKNGGGAEVAMEWVENGLIGPGLLPYDERGEFKDLAAQKWFDENADAELKGQKGCQIMQPKGWRGALLWTLYHHQGGSSPIGQPIRALLGIGEHDRLTPDQIQEAKAFGAQRELPLIAPPAANRIADTMDHAQLDALGRHQGQA